MDLGESKEMRVIRLHKDGIQPYEDEVFVFGSNLAGIHGAGAAKQAIKYGAKYGQGIGLSGRTYAIPTKDDNIQTLPLSEIEVHVENFVKFSTDNPETTFFLTRIGCGLAGYKDRDIAPMFKGCGGNCIFPEQWETFLS